MSAAILLIGVGNTYRCDDRVGLMVVRSIQKRRLPGVACIEYTGDGAGLLEIMTQSETILLIDAVKSGTAPGTIHKFDMRKNPLPTEITFMSSHVFGVSEAIQLAKVINRLPPSLIIYGIEGSDFGVGATLSPVVARVVPEVVALIFEDIRRID